jgi:hypothetical protein
MVYVLGLNGPPRSGKDTIAQMILEESTLDIPIKIDHLSEPLRRIAFAMVGRVYVHDQADAYEEFKSTLFPQFNRTGRQLMIDVSESFLKPTYGQQVMAQMLVERNKNFSGLLIVPDSGFVCEIAPLHEWCNPTPRQNRGGSSLTRTVNNNFFVCRVHRDGTTFKGDSREWVYADNEMDLANNGSLDDLTIQVRHLTSRLRELKWPL